MSLADVIDTLNALNLGPAFLGVFAVVSLAMTVYAAFRNVRR